MRKFVVFSGLITALALSAIPARAGSMLESEFASGNIYDVNTSTGATSNARPTGLFLEGVAYNSGGTLYGLDQLSQSLYTINTTTGTPTLVGATNLVPGSIEGDIAFSPGGTLYGIQNVSTDLQLFTISTSTGMATVVGSIIANFASQFPTSDLSGMAFAPDGTLFVIDDFNGFGGSKLYTVNTGNGAILTSVNLSVQLGTAVGFTYDTDNGKYYVTDGDAAGTNTLYTLDVSTGVLTSVGPTGLTSGSGLAFNPPASPAAVPVPASAYAGLVLVGLLAACRMGRRLLPRAVAA